MNLLARIKCTLTSFLWTIKDLDFWLSLFEPPVVLSNAHNMTVNKIEQDGYEMRCQSCGKTEFWLFPIILALLLMLACAPVDARPLILRPKRLGYIVFHHLVRAPLDALFLPTAAGLYWAWTHVDETDQHLNIETADSWAEFTGVSSGLSTFPTITVIEGQPR